jgi:isoleucyl-tRNA synthetase
VLDCWFESGSMPFAQVHYPFENKAWFEQHFPGDFITEYVAQTRGWFYTLMVLSTALFDRAPFKNCVCHGVVVDETKQKLSKRLKNYPDPTEVFQKYGADALRWYMVSSPLFSGGDLAMPKDGSAIGEAVRHIMLPVWNAFSFFTLYANADGVKASFRADAEGELDRYILAKTRDFVEAMQSALDAFDVPRATATVPPFLDVLNNWYIRRSRVRFWAEGASAEKRDAYDTLYTVLVTVSRTLAPLLPFLCETVHGALCGGDSVHLARWPDLSAFPSDAALVARMDLAREACSAALSIRTEQGLRVRQPLRELTVAHPSSAMLEAVAPMIADEVNVKAVRFVDDPGRFGTSAVAVDPRVGRRLGAALRAVREAGLAGKWTALPDGRIEILGQVIEPGEYELRFDAAVGIAAAPFAGGTGVAVLDTALDRALELEGYARDFVRLVQAARKSAGLDISDRIAIEVRAADEAGAAIDAHADMIRGEVLAVSLTPVIGEPGGTRSSGTLGEAQVEFGIRPAT